MTFPVLLLQGDLDDGQPPLYYDDPSNPATAQFSDARLQWVKGPVITPHSVGKIRIC
jgi:hypothetical protein